MAEQEPTPRTLVAAATRTLHEAGVGSPALDAEMLLAHTLGVDRTRLVTVDRVESVAHARYQQLVARRAAREPLQYLVGTAPFRYLDLAVGPGVFVPRPETELLVDAVRPAWRGVDRPVAVDLCAGSGALALAVLHEVPHATAYAVESAPNALPWLRRNAAGTRLNVVAGDVRDAHLLAELAGRVDAVLSNPPYVPIDTTVGAEVRHDPPDAVFAGSDGLALIPAVVAAAARLLRSGGLLALEHDDCHAPTVIGLLESVGAWSDIAPHRDLTGRPRYVTGVRRGP